MIENTLDKSLKIFSLFESMSFWVNCPHIFSILVYHIPFETAQKAVKHLDWRLDFGMRLIFKLQKRKACRKPLNMNLTND